VAKHPVFIKLGVGVRVGARAGAEEGAAGDTDTFVNLLTRLSIMLVSGFVDGVVEETPWKDSI
jgi:hypothetical protein